MARTLALFATTLLLCLALGEGVLRIAGVTPPTFGTAPVHPGAPGFGSRMPQTPDAISSPNFQARIVSGKPLPATTGKASEAPASASFRISGIGLNSVLIGEKPETTAPFGTSTGNARCVMVSTAAARAVAGIASRRASADWRSADF